jgi:hypothetical protein
MALLPFQAGASRAFFLMVFLGKSTKGLFIKLNVDNRTK